MSTLLKIDLKARLIISIVYRILIALYGISICLKFQQNSEVSTCIIITFIYILIFAILYGQNGIFSYARLFLDYLYIFFVIHNTSIDSFYVSTFLFLPILNSGNHTSNKKSILLYLIPIIFLVYIKNYSWYILIPFIMFIIINFFGTIRFGYIDFNENLNSLVDDFLINQESNKPHKIYKKAIEILNKTSLILFKTKKILCLRVNGSQSNLVNASEFVWNYTLDENKFFQNLNEIKSKNLTIYHSDLMINNIKYPRNVCFIYEVYNIKYCYFIIPSEENNFIIDNSILPFFNELIAPFFIRLSKIFESNIENKKFEVDKIIEMENKISYVQNAISSMHFIRNKLGPIYNYLEMMSDYNKLETSKEKESLNLIIINERQKLGVSIDNILDRANYILDKSNNPFTVNDLKFHNIKKLYNEIKRVWESYFDNFKPIINLDIINNNYEVKFNDVGLELVFVNWFNNIKRYGSDIRNVTLFENDQYLIIDFQNSVSDLLGAIEVVKVFSSIDRIEILKRQTHGLIEIIDFLEQMNIHYKAFLEGNILHLHLKFIKHKIK